MILAIMMCMRIGFVEDVSQDLFQERGERSLVVG